MNLFACVVQTVMHKKSTQKKLKHYAEKGNNNYYYCYFCTVIPVSNSMQEVFVKIGKL